MTSRTNKNGARASETLTGDIVRPFLVGGGDVRGRMVRLGPVLDDIIGLHTYPPGVNELLVQTCTLAALMASLMKFDGIFTLQIQGEGPVSLLVADMTSEGGIRACAQYDADKFDDTSDLGTKLDDIFGNRAEMVFTVDQGDASRRYQGVVEIKPEGLKQSLLHYFNQSEQIPTDIRLYCDRQDGVWLASSLLLQKMPAEEAGARGGESAPETEDIWTKCGYILDTLGRGEMLDPGLAPDDLLYKLFHEDGVFVYPEWPVTRTCRCDKERMRATLATMSDADLAEMVQDDEIRLKCQYCNTDLVFDMSAPQTRQG